MPSTTMGRCMRKHRKSRGGRSVRHHLAIYIEGDYCPDQDDVPGGHAHVETQYRASHEAAMASGPEKKRELFTRLLTTVVAVAGAKPRAAKRKASAVKKTKRPRR